MRPEYGTVGINGLIRLERTSNTSGFSPAGGFNPSTAREFMLLVLVLPRNGLRESLFVPQLETRNVGTLTGCHTISRK